jgi:hypothetical protein
VDKKKRRRKVIINQNGTTFSVHAKKTWLAFYRIDYDRFI